GREESLVLRDPIADYLQDSLEPYLADLHEVVSIDSGTHSKAGVDAVGRVVESRLLDLGCEVERIPHDVYGDSLVARLRGSGSAKLVMVAHMDTVYPDGTAERRPFHIAGDRAYGPGTSDMKNGLLAGLYVMRALEATAQLPFRELVYFLNPDEEVGSPISASEIDGECRDATAAFVLESARQDGSVVVARKGVGDYKVLVHGRSSHAGVDPESGRSAIHELAHKIVALTQLNGLSEGTTVNVGVVQGGTRPNVVADFAMCQVDIRVATMDDYVQLDSELRRLLSMPTIPGTSIKVESDHCFPPMERNERNMGLFELARQVASGLGLELRGTATGGGSDANHISALGIPVLDGLGPIGKGAHSSEENLYIPSVVERGTLLGHLIAEVGRRGGTIPPG
ncbi:MAG: M20 family metallopeptidase, partial [Chloroflexota bacterium]|nr:M20 family metallopeptidase [Chloroflexota bacterium]